MDKMKLSSTLNLHNIEPCLRYHQGTRSSIILPPPYPSLEPYAQYSPECEECLREIMAEGGSYGQYIPIRPAPVYEPRPARVHNNHNKTDIKTLEKRCINYDQRGDLVSIFANPHPVRDAVVPRRAGQTPVAVAHVYHSQYKASTPVYSAENPHDVATVAPVRPGRYEETPSLTADTSPSDASMDDNTRSFPQTLPQQQTGLTSLPSNSFFKQPNSRPRMPLKWTAINHGTEGAKEAARKAGRDAYDAEREAKVARNSTCSKTRPTGREKRQDGPAGS